MMCRDHEDSNPDDGRCIVAIAVDGDALAASRRARALAASIGFAGNAAELIATAVAEIARNIAIHAGRGEIVMAPTEGRFGIQIVALDAGPGIRDVAKAMEDGYSTRGSLGIGLSVARRIMDEFSIESSPASGTKVTMRKWLP